MLPGWKESKGALLEFEVAKICGIRRSKNGQNK